MRDDHLKHYASPYYDPVKAHEYYMRTRELKGRPSTAGLNEEGRTAAKVVKESLNDERKEMTSYFKEKTHSDIQSHSAHMRYQIKTLRQELNDRYDEEGGEVMLRELETFDPETAQRLHPSDKKRIVRAIEIYRSTGINMTEHIQRSRLVPSPYEVTAIGLTFADRQKLYERINTRVDRMLENGLVEEARDFYADKKGHTASAAIGYKELRLYLEGRISLEAAVEKLKMETRRFAKRQMTWFRGMERRGFKIHWIDATLPMEEKVSQIIQIVNCKSENRKS